MADTVVVYAPGLWSLCAEFPVCSGGSFPEGITFEEAYIPTSGPPPTSTGSWLSLGLSCFQQVMQRGGMVRLRLPCPPLLLGCTCSGRVALEADLQSPSAPFTSQAWSYSTPPPPPEFWGPTLTFQQAAAYLSSFICRWPPGATAKATVRLGGSGSY